MRSFADSLFSILGNVTMPSGRIATAGVMLIMAGGRFGWWRSQMVTSWLNPDVYGWMLALGGVLLIVSHPWRLHWRGRIIAVLTASLLGGMAYDAGTISTTSLVMGWFALLLMGEAVTSHDC